MSAHTVLRRDLLRVRACAEGDGAASRRDEIARRVATAARQLDREAVLDRLPKQLSGG